MATLCPACPQPGINFDAATRTAPNTKPQTDSLRESTEVSGNTTSNRYVFLFLRYYLFSDLMLFARSIITNPGEDVDRDGRSGANHSITPYGDGYVFPGTKKTADPKNLS